MEIIEKDPNKSWNWNWGSFNPNLTMDFIEKNLEKIHFEHLSYNTFNNK